MAEQEIEQLETPEFTELIPKPGGQGMMRLRDYQTECVDCIFEAWQENRAVLSVLATGLGKTVIAAEVCARFPGDGRILFIAHVGELIDQAQEKIGYHLDDAVSVEMGIRRDEAGALGFSRVLVASIQSMVRRLDKFHPEHFDLIIIDEFHHAGANTYRKLWAWLSQGNPQAKLLGITATPNRHDKVSLACIADTCAFEMGIRDAIDSGWLVPIKQQYIVVDELDFSACRTVARDLNERDLEGVMMGGRDDGEMSDEERRELIEKQERMLHAVAAPTVKEAQGRPGIIYGVTINHCGRLSEVLRRYPGVTAELIHGGTPAKERADLVGRFKAGTLQFLVNVGIATEGFDVPGAHLIVMARPTKSAALYQQMIGRGTRPLPGLVDKYDTPEDRQEAISNSAKPWMTVLDFVGNSGRHKLISTADVLAGDMPEQFVLAAVEEMRKTGKSEDIREAAWRKKQEHDSEVQRRQEEQKRQHEERVKRIQAMEEARRMRVRAEAEYRSRDVDPFNRHDIAPQRHQPEFRGGASDQQVKYLTRLGIPEETAMRWTKKQAGAVISDLANRTGGKFIMRFGKNKGKALKDMPVHYLKWAGENIHDDTFQTNLALYRKEWMAEHGGKQDTDDDA